MRLTAPLAVLGTGTGTNGDVVVAAIVLAIVVVVVEQWLAVAGVIVWVLAKLLERCAEEILLAGLSAESGESSSPNSSCKSPAAFVVAAGFEFVIAGCMERGGMEGGEGSSDAAAREGC